MDAFELWCWRRLLRVPWTARRSNQSILKEISPEYSLERLRLKLKLQYFGHLMWRAWLIGKDPDVGKDWGWEEKGMTEDKMVGWHHGLDGHEFEQAPGVGDRQGSLACCSPWGHKELDITEQLNWTDSHVWYSTVVANAPLFIFHYFIHSNTVFWPHIYWMPAGHQALWWALEMSYGSRLDIYTWPPVCISWGHKEGGFRLDAYNY